MRQIALLGSGSWTYDRVVRKKFKTKGIQLVTTTLDPIIPHLGPFVIRWYSLILLTAIFVGVGLLPERQSDEISTKKSFLMFQSGSSLED